MKSITFGRLKNGMSNVEIMLNPRNWIFGVSWSAGEELKNMLVGDTRLVLILHFGPLGVILTFE